MERPESTPIRRWRHEEFGSNRREPCARKSANAAFVRLPDMVTGRRRALRRFRLILAQCARYHRRRLFGIGTVTAGG